MRALAADEEWRLSADGSECTDGRIDTTGDESFGSLLEFAGAVKFTGHGEILTTRQDGLTQLLCEKPV
jgi:hypothetical protein